MAKWLISASIAFAALEQASAYTPPAANTQKLGRRALLSTGCATLLSPLVLPVQTANAEFVGTVRKGDQSLIGVSSTYDVKMKAEGNKGAGVTPVSLKPVREGVPMFAPKGTTEAKNIFQQNDPVIKK